MCEKSAWNGRVSRLATTRTPQKHATTRVAPPRPIARTRLDEAAGRDRAGDAGDVDEQVVGVGERTEVRLVDRHIGAPREGELRRRHRGAAAGERERRGVALLAEALRSTPVPAPVLVAKVTWMLVSNLSSAQFTSVTSSTGPPPAALLPSSEAAT